MSFHVRDIYLPGPVEFVESLDPDTEVLGYVVGFSDSGPSPGTFAIVQTDGRKKKKVVVPVDSLSPIRRLAPPRDSGRGAQPPKRRKSA